ncbi:MAG: ChaN family lipoprotein [Chlorobi bacterium]|nr:ChaN family lipoprotein [Chlorobiota bacterium]
MKSNILFLFIAAFLSVNFASDKPAYKLFDKNGKEVSYKKMLKALNKADAVLIGELHNNPISHWAELVITEDLAKMHPEGLTLGAEMFEADNQLILDEYLKGYFPAKKFEADARLWPNYKTDYKPLVEFAKEKKYRFVATNIPRRYASIVFKHGFNGLNKLSEEAKKYIAPLPPEYDAKLKCYSDMIEAGKQMGDTCGYYPKAQAIKDATMAYFILKNIEPGKIFIHYNGAYHSDNYESIVWYLKRKKPDLKILTVTTVEQKNIDVLNEENKLKADYIFAVPESMTKTY